jgi:PIN domain nuclease of toxin-antitoxin system
VRLLVDTHLLIWVALGDSRVPSSAARIFRASDNDLAFSVASLWEIAIKRALGRPDFNVDAAALREGFLKLGYTELPVSGEHALRVADLPRRHGDPFDRLLVAVALEERRTLLTVDRQLQAYGDVVRRV